jgi:hypothetical protein
LSANRAMALFASSFWDTSSICLNVLRTTVGSGHNCRRSAHVPGQLPASIRLLGVFVNGRSGDVLFEPVQLRYKFLDLLLDIFKFLRATVSVVRDDHRLDQYLIVLDERAHPPRAALRGGNQSADSFAISRSILVRSLRLSASLLGESKPSKGWPRRQL